MRVCVCDPVDPVDPADQEDPVDPIDYSFYGLGGRCVSHRNHCNINKDDILFLLWAGWSLHWSS